MITRFTLQFEGCYELTDSDISKIAMKCGEYIFKTMQVKKGSVEVWCSQCEHTMRIDDYDSDPIMTVFEGLNE